VPSQAAAVKIGVSASVKRYHRRNRERLITVWQLSGRVLFLRADPEMPIVHQELCSVFLRSDGYSDVLKDLDVFDIDLDAMGERHQPSPHLSRL
jgi:hypothetical protein